MKSHSLIILLVCGLLLENCKEFEPVSPNQITVPGNRMNCEGRTLAPIIPTKSIVLAVDPNILSKIEVNFNQFKEDLASDGYAVVVHNVVETRPIELRKTIQNYFQQLTPKLEGVIFIGKVPLPIAIFNTNSNLQIHGISMQYYMDLDGVFTFRGSEASDSIDSHTGNVEIEIWTSIIPLYMQGLFGIDNINNYLKKNHAYRAGCFSVQKGMIQPVIGAHIDTKELYDYQYHVIRNDYHINLNKRGNFFIGIDNTLGDLTTYPNAKVSYEKEMLTDKYDVASIGAHGNEISFGSFDRWGSIIIDVDYARTKKIKPIFLFENSCSTADLRYTPNLACSFLYNSNNNVLVFAGATAFQGGMGKTVKGMAINYEAELLTTGQPVGVAHFAAMALPFITEPFASFREYYAAQQILLGDGTLKLQEFMPQ